MLLFPCLVCFPMVTFAIVLIFGHELPLGRSLPSCWLDRICIHQTDMGKKKEQINALPVFVAQSSKMLVLWDQTYFERLWCNLELATCARYGGTDKVELMPLWLAPWLLSTILLDLSSASILEVMVHLFPNFSAAWMHDIPEMPIFGHNPAMESFVSSFDVWMFSGISYLPVSIPSFFCFRAKLLSHQLMLEQMSTFDVRAARCTVASDRASIEEQARAQGFSCCQDQAPGSIIFTQVSKGFNRQIIGILDKQRRFMQMTVEHCRTKRKNIKMRNLLIIVSYSVRSLHGGCNFVWTSQGQVRCRNGPIRKITRNSKKIPNAFFSGLDVVMHVLQNDKE